jgi:hypothetical protein
MWQRSPDAVEEQGIFAGPDRKCALSNAGSVNNSESAASSIVDGGHKNGTETVRRLCVFDRP